MILEHIGLSQINGSLVVLDGVKGVQYDEMAELHLDDGSTRVGRVVRVDGDRCVIQVFEGTRGLSLVNNRTVLTGHPMMMDLSPELLGRVLDGLGRPIDGLGDIYPVARRDVNGAPINPVSRVYPRNYIHTGISSIDCLATLIRGQKLPIFSVRPAWPTGRTSPSCSPPWASRTTLRRTSARASRVAARWSASSCC